jgi:hypothetical protein
LKQTPMMKTILFHILCLTFFSSWAFAAEEYKFEASEIEKKPYHLGGFGEVRPVLNVLDKNAALYKANFYNQNLGATTKEYNFRVQLEGSYEEGIARVFMRFNQDVKNTYQGWSSDGTLYEGFLSLKPSNSYSLDMGKKTFKWGKGYAWNPVAFIDRPKDPNDPDLALEGFWTLSGDYIRSFSGPLKTFSFTPVFLPVTTGINDDFAGGPGNPAGTPASSTADRINLAAKFYFLLYDTDFDFIFLTGGSKTTRYGVDFSRNINTNMEIHGELAHIEDFTKSFINANGKLFTQTFDATNYLLGMRYLTAIDTTYILEYYHDGTGFTKDQMSDYFSFVNKGYNQYLTTGNAALIQRASSLAQGGYGRNTPETDYLYLRISQKEPFDILYFTPAITGIVNLKDRSFSMTPELLYTGITNLELRLKTFFLAGKGSTEFGEKPNDYRIELRARYYF